MAELNEIRMLGDPETGVLLVSEGGRLNESGVFSALTRIYVPEIIIQGAFLDVPDDESEWWKKLVAVETLLVRSASRAAVALSWLQSLHNQTLARLDRQRRENAEDISDPNSAVRRRDAARALREQSIPSALPDDQRQRMARRLAVADGIVPVEMESQYAEMHQDMYVFALDGVNRGLMELLKALRERDQKALVSSAQGQFLSAVGDVTKARHSLHHPEDWLQGRGRGENRRTGVVSPDPINSPEIQAPQGAMVIMSVDGERLSVTAGDGSHAEIVTTEEGLLAVIEATQQALNAMPRRGITEIRPYG